MQPTRTALLIPLLSLLALRSAAQQPPTQPQDPIPTLHVTTRIVALDVVVSDGHGHPGSGLTASDFHLTEDGVPQTIDSITEHDASTPAESDGEDDALPPNTFKVQPPVKNNGAMTVIVVVASHWGDFIHSQLKGYFQKPVTTPTAIFRMDETGMHLIQGFTSNRNLLTEAVISKRIWMVIGPRFHADPASFRVRAVGPRTQALAAYLAGVPGRINIVWIGGVPREGEVMQDFPDESSALADASRMVDTLNQSTNMHRISRVALYNISIGGCGHGRPDNPIGGRSFACTFPRDALNQIASTSYHYYTLSYRPTNSNWDGDYRHIHLDVTGYAQPPFTIRWSQLITGWADDVEPTLMYRKGYFANSAPASGTDTRLVPNAPSMRNATLNTTADAPPSARRKLISTSPKGDYGPNSAQIAAATAFGSPTPVQLHFTIVATPAPEQEITKARENLPAGNFLTTPFRDGPYRNYRIHYRIDPQELHLVQTARGTYQDDLRMIAVVYRDDGVTANSLATVTHLDLSAVEAETILTSGFTLDQSIAVPTTENFFLRTVVAEESTSHLGAIEIPVEWIKPLPAAPVLTSIR